MKNLETLIQLVSDLYENNAIHVKRGFRLRTEGSNLVASNHLIEEAVELQAELIAENREATVEEAGDLLTLMCHILKRNNISIEEIAASAVEKVARSYTLNPEEVTAITPGVTRRGRAPKHPENSLSGQYSPDANDRMDAILRQ